MRRSKKTSKLRVTGLCEGNSKCPVNPPPQQRASNEEKCFHLMMSSCSQALERMIWVSNAAGLVWTSSTPWCIFRPLMDSYGCKTANAQYILLRSSTNMQGICISVMSLTKRDTGCKLFIWNNESILHVWYWLYEYWLYGYWLYAQMCW